MEVFAGEGERGREGWGHRVPSYRGDAFVVPCGGCAGILRRCLRHAWRQWRMRS
jgi:hypothetical protein